MKRLTWRAPGAWSRRRVWTVTGVAGVLVAAALAWIFWPSPVEPRARQYRDVTACLLTDRQGVTGTNAAAVWAGMQAASLRTHGQVRYLAVTGDQTVGNAQTFVGTLLAGRCSVIVAAPGIADGAVRAVALQHPEQRFLVVGGDAPTLSNMSRVEGSSASDITSRVSAAVGDRLAADS